jgi:hypothetical protein
MAGVLLVGLAGINFKVAYLVGHSLQAGLLALHSKSAPCGTQILNMVTWKVGKSKALTRRREAYLWATTEITGNVEWLREWNLANDDVVKYVQENVVKHTKVSILPDRALTTRVSNATKVARNNLVFCWDEGNT